MNLNDSCVFLLGRNLFCQRASNVSCILLNFKYFCIFVREQGLFSKVGIEFHVEYLSTTYISHHRKKHTRPCLVFSSGNKRKTHLLLLYADRLFWLIIKEKSASQGSCLRIAIPLAHSAAAFSHSELVLEIISSLIFS